MTTTDDSQDPLGARPRTGGIALDGKPRQPPPTMALGTYRFLRIGVIGMILLLAISLPLESYKASAWHQCRHLPMRTQRATSRRGRLGKRRPSQPTNQLSRDRPATIPARDRTGTALSDEELVCRALRWSGLLPECRPRSARSPVKKQSTT